MHLGCFNNGKNIQHPKVQKLDCLLENLQVLQVDTILRSDQCVWSVKLNIRLKK